MIVTSQTSNVLGSTSGRWRVWSLSDGYIEMPADLLRDTQDNPVPQALQAKGASPVCQLLRARRSRR
ncbi:MAG: hypothetical protein E5W69_02915 [Mesorhizobium sp.]|nr:MAG: hypothetical protein E5W69_02915 [Mesorhizobium sp.]